MFEILKPFLEMDKVLFPRRFAFIESVLIDIILFFDGSKLPIHQKPSEKWTDYHTAAEK